MECIICLTDISINDFYKLICCNNDVHIKCINEWIHSNINNKDISKCFICSQKNDIIQDIVSMNNNIYFHNNQSNIYIDMEQDIDIDNQNNITEVNIINNDLYIKIKIKIISFIIIICICICSFSIIILLN